MYEKTHIIGLGGVGFHLTTALCKAVDPKSIYAYDLDSLEGGLGHMRLPQASLSTKKTSLLRGHLLVAWGTEPPNLVTEWFTGDEPEPNDLVVDCSDIALPERRKIWKKVRDKDIRIIRVSYDGKENTIVVAEGLPLVSSKKGGYSEVPSLALSFAAGGIGAEVVSNVISGNLLNHVEFQISINKLAGLSS